MKLIFAHADPDGITSARIAMLSDLYKDAVVAFTQYTDFGFNSPSLAEGYDELLALDIGCNSETIEKLGEVADKIPVKLFDHHIPDNSLVNVQRPNFRIVHSIEHCTASLIYSTLKQIGALNNEWADRWAIVGIYSDVAKDKPGAKAVLDSLKSQYRELISQTEEEDAPFYYQPASMVGRAFNMARRVAYHNGALISLKVCEEVERANDIFLPVRGISHEEMVLYPYTAILRQLVTEYMEISNRQTEERIIDLDMIAVGIISCEADIGGLTAKRIAEKLDKPVLIINDRTPNAYKVSGRNPNKGRKINLRDLILEANSLAPDFIEGGGHPDAASGKVAEPNLMRFAKVISLAASIASHQEGS